jgi:hypothetical protein
LVRTDSGSYDDIEDFDQASFQVVCRARIEPSIRATSKHVGTPVVRHPLSYLVEPGDSNPRLVAAATGLPAELLRWLRFEAGF